MQYHAYARRKLGKRDAIQLLGFSLVVEPDVFHPQLFISSKFLGRYVGSLLLKNTQVLDMGTGSGIIALCAARLGASVTAVDLNPTAVRCAAENFGRNGFEGKITILQCDLFSSLPRRPTFDYIIWNPPFYEGDPVTAADFAWKAGTDYETIRRFAHDAADYLSRSGRIILILSSDGNPERVLSFFHEQEFRSQTTAATRRLFETLRVYELSR